MNIPAKLDVSSAPGTAGFWSGSMDEAIAFAKANGKTVLETTPGMKLVLDWPLMNSRIDRHIQNGQWDNVVEPYFGAISNKYARGTSGEVFVLQTPDRALSTGLGIDVSGGPFFRKYENPVINTYLSTGRITNVNYTFGTSSNYEFNLHQLLGKEL